jgi:hypothetical protein
VALDEESYRMSYQVITDPKFPGQFRVVRGRLSLSFSFCVLVCLCVCMLVCVFVCLRVLDMCVQFGEVLGRCALTVPAVFLPSPFLSVCALMSGRGLTPPPLVGICLG